MYGIIILFLILAGLIVMAFLIRSILDNMDAPKSLKSVPCDLCPQMINAKTGRHPKSIGIGYGEFHNIHLYRRHGGEPMIQGSWKELQAQQQLKAAAEKERDKDQELQRLFNEVQNQPLGDDFVKTLDIL